MRRTKFNDAVGNEINLISEPTDRSKLTLVCYRSGRRGMAFPTLTPALARRLAAILDRWATAAAGAAKKARARGALRAGGEA